MINDKRLIEDYLPIQAISAEASREKSVRKGHISTLHLWWARRPLVACRAAVYGALVPASQFVPENGPDNKKQSLGRANAAKFMKRLCRYPSDSKPEIKADTEKMIQEAQGHILDAHAERLTQGLAEAEKTGNWPSWVDEFKWPKEKDKVSRQDIEAGRAPRPRVLDMFAGGGAIPLEALRLGCEAYAQDLNPVAHIIELCTLVYPQKYGKPDSKVRGMTGPKNDKRETTWGGLAEEVRYWGNWVLEKVKAEIGDLYPLIPDPEADDEEIAAEPQQVMDFAKDPQGKLKVKKGYLIPVAYLWTRTVKCKNPACGATVPLVKQTWLCKKKDRYVALRMIAPKGEKEVRFEVVEHISEKDLDFDPTAFSSAGNATCPFCGTVADSDYVKAEGCAKLMGQQMMAIACTRPGSKGKIYLSADDYLEFIPNDTSILKRIDELCKRTGLTVPNEPIITDAKNSCWTHLYGFTNFGNLFISRQILCLLTFAENIRSAFTQMHKNDIVLETRAVATCLASILDRLVDFNSTGCTWNYTGGRGVLHTMARQAIPMTWDFAETYPFNPNGASWVSGIEDVSIAYEQAVTTGKFPATVMRGSATSIQLGDAILDAVITDPPYYDNIPYANISDYFYVWLRRTIGDYYPEHFATEGTPKKKETVADALRHGGDKYKARTIYEQMMLDAFAEANRTLKTRGYLVVVYAHKTTLGWATLIEALRKAGFIVTEAWPLNTERSGRLRAMDSAALASSIFIVARKRGKTSSLGSYESEVRSELEGIVHERVKTLWGQGIIGADLVIAAVGAGLRAFTKYERVEYANGEEVPAEKFLAEVESVVLDVMMEQIAGKVGRGVAAVDSHSRFYVLWRYVYKTGAVDAGEAIVFTYGQQVELDGQHGLSTGHNTLVEKKKSSYRLRDYTERGKDEKLGLPTEDGEPAPLIDVLHRLLWLMENRTPELATFFRDTIVNREQMRLLAQALAGPALEGGELGDLTSSTEQAALAKLTANWRSVVEDAARDQWEEGLGKEG